MARASKEYLRSLIPADLPPGKEILDEGRNMGDSIKAGRSRLIRESDYSNYLEYFKAQASRKEIAWITNVGL